MVSSTIDLDTTQPQAVAINDGVVPFEATVSISPPEGSKSYQIAFVDSIALDSGNIEYKTVSGNQTQSIRYASAELMEFYVMLKSTDRMTGVRIDVDVTKLQPNPDEQESQNVTRVAPMPPPTKGEKRSKVRLFAGIIVVVAAAILIVYFAKKKKNIAMPSAPIDDNF